MTRKEIYKYIKECGLGTKIKAEFGINYTIIPTNDLARFIEKEKAHTCKPKEPEVNEPQTPCCNIDMHKFLASYCNLLSALVVKKVLTPEEAKGVLNQV